MKRNTLFSFLTIAALGLLTAGPANAACTFTWTGSVNDDFRNSGNWTTSGECAEDYPTTGDTVIIPDVTTDPIIDDQNEVFGELQIATDGLLTITGKMLTLDGTTTHDIDGDLVLSNGTSALLFSDSVTVAGDGEIIGQDNGAGLRIATGKTLTNNMLISGHMEILVRSGSATFVNSGTVLSNADGGTLLMKAGLTLTDGGSCSSAVWAAIGDTVNFTTQPVLKFEESATGLTSEFRLDHCATIQLAAGVNITTTNTLKDEAGTAIAQGYIKTGGNFVYRDSCPNGSQNTLGATCTLIGSECNDC